MINFLNRFVVLALLFTGLMANAQAFGPQLTYHGRILDTAASNAPVTGNVQFLIQIVHPDVPTCVLYQETQSQNLTAADGNFTLTVNGGSSTLPAALLNPFADVFITDSNRTINCINGGTVPGTVNSRKLNVFFVPPGGSAYEPLPSQAINYVPLAIEALNTNAVGGFGASSLLRVVEINGFGVPIPYTVPAITRPLYEELDATIKGQSSYYVTSQGTVAYFSVPLTGEVTGAQSSTVVSKIMGKAVNPAGGTYVGGEVMYYDGAAWIAKPGIAGTVQTVNSTNAYLTVSGGAPSFDPTINPLLTLHVGTTANTVAAGDDSRIVNAFSALTPLMGDVTGLVSNTVVATVGGKSASAIAASVNDTQAATSANTNSTIVKRDSSGNITVGTLSSTNTGTKNLLLYNAASTQNATINVPSALAVSYTLTLPSTLPVSGFVLATDGAGLTRWISPTTGNVTNVSATAPLSSTGGFTPTISITRASTTVDGYLASSDFTTFNNKIASVTVTSPLTLSGTSLTPTIGLQNSGVTAGTYTKFTVDIKGIITSATTLLAADIPNLDTSKITTGTFPIARGGTGSNSFTANGYVTVDASGTSMASTACAANEVPFYNGTTWGCKTASSANSSATIVMRDASGNFTANNITTVQDMTVQRNLRVQDGSVGGYIGLTTPVGVSNYDIVLPGNGAPSLGQVLSVASGSTSATIKTTWITALTDVLASGQIIVGNASGTAVPVTMSGDATLSNTGNLQLISVGSGVTSGTQYTKVTVDGKGRVLSGTQLNNADVVSGLGYVPMNTVSAVAPIVLTGGASNPVISFATSGVTSGTYGSTTLIPSFIVDPWGRITSATASAYADATAGSKGIVQIGSNITVTAGTISVTSANIVAAMGSLGGDVSGTLNATVVQTVGGKTAAQISQSVSDTIAATSVSTSGTIVKRDANGDFSARNITTLQDLTVQRNLRIQDGSVGGYIGFTTPVGVSNYDIMLPANGAPSVGQVLSVASGSTSATIKTTWINALTDSLNSGFVFVGNASGVATGVAMSGDATMSNTGNFQLVSVGAGITSGSQYTKVTLDAKGRVVSGAQLNNADVVSGLGYVPMNTVSSTTPITLTGGASNPVIGLATTGVVSGSYGSNTLIPNFIVDVWGRITSMTTTVYADATSSTKGILSVGANLTVSSGVISLNSANIVSAMGTLGGDVSGTLSNTVVQTVGGKTSAQISQSVSDTLAATSVSTSGTIVKRDANGDFSARNITTLQDLTVQRNLRVQDGSVGGYIGLTTPVGISNYDIVLPANGAPSMGQVLSVASGSTSATIKTYWMNALTDVLPAGYVIVGNASGTASGVAISGDVTMSSSGQAQLVLVGSGVTSGSQYTKVTLDGKGRVVSGSQLNNADVVSGLGYVPMNTVSAATPIALSGGASNPVISLNTSGVVSGSYGSSTLIPSFLVDAWGRITSVTTTVYADATSATKGILSVGANLTVSSGVISLNSANIVSAMGTLGGDVSGTLSNTVVMTVGGKTSAQISQSVSDTLAATHLSTSGTIVKRDANGDFSARNITTLQDLTVQRNLRVQDGSVGGYIGLTTPVGISNYDIVLPANGAPSTGQVLAVASGSTSATIKTQWINALTDSLLPGNIFVGNSSGTATGVTMSGDATMSNIGNLQLVSVGAGVTSGTAYTKVTVDGKGRVTSGTQLNSNDVVTALGYTPADNAASGTYMRKAANLSDVASSATARTNLGLGTLAVGDFVDLGSASATGIIADARLQNFAGVVSGTQYSKLTVDGKGRVTSGAQLSNADINAALGYVPTNVVSTTSPLTLSGGASNPVIGLANSGVTSGTYPKVTVDVWGRVTSGTGLNFTDVTSGLGYVPVEIVSATSPIFLTGPASAPVINLATSGVTSGTYPKVTVDQWGRVTSGTVLNNADVTTGLGYQPTNVVSVTAPLAISGGASNPVISLNTTGVTSGTYPKVTVDSWGRVTSGTGLNFTDVTSGLGYTPVQIVSATAPIFLTGSASSPVINLSNSGVTAGTYGSSTLIPSFIVDAWGRITSATSSVYADATSSTKGILSVGANLTVSNGVISLNSSNVVSAMGSLSGDVTGALNSTTVATVGGRTAANIATTVDAVASATSANSSGTIVRRDANGDFTARNITTVQNMTVQSNLRVQNGIAGNYIGVATPVGLGASYDLILPDNSVAPVAGQILAVASGSTATNVLTRWMNTLSDALPSTFIYVGNASGVATGVALSGDATISNTGNLQFNSVGAGVTSGTAYTKVTVDGKGRVTSATQLNSNDVVTALGYTPADNAASGTYMQKAANLSDVANSATARTNLGLGTLAVGNSIDLGSASATGIIADARLQNFANVTSGSVYSKLTVDGKGRVVSGANLSNADINAALGYVPMASVSTTSPITMTGGASNPTIGLANSGVTAATYPKVTVDVWGRVTSGTGLNFSDVTSGLGYTPVEIVSATTPLFLTGSASSPVINLATSGVTSGTYPKVTVDAWGRVTSGTILNMADVTTGLGYTPTNLVSAVAPLSISGGASNPVLSLNTTGVTSGTYPKVTVDAWGRVTSGTGLTSSDVTAGLGYTPVQSVSATSPLTITGGASNPVLNLSNSGVTAGTYGSSTGVPYFTVDSWGRVTSAGTQAYADATAGVKGIVQIGSNITVTAGTISVTSANVIAAMGTLGGDVSGTLNATVVQTVGGRTAANIATTVDAVASATPNNSSGTIVRRDANGDFTARNITTIQDMTVYGNMRVQNGLTGGSIGITTPVGLTSGQNYNIVLPQNGAPAAGQVLGVASGSTASLISTVWVNALTDYLANGQIYMGNASNTATGVTVAGDATIANTGVLTLASVGSGITSGSQYTKVTVDGKGRVVSGAGLNNADVVSGLGYVPMNSVSSTSPVTISGGASNPVIGLANSGVTAATYGSSFTMPIITVDALGRITSVASQTLRVADATNPGVVSISSNITVSTSGQISLTGGNVTSALGYTPVNRAGDTMTGTLAVPTISATTVVLGATSSTFVIGSATQTPGSIVDIASNSKGFLLPRMTTVQRDAIVSGAAQDGLQIFNTTTRAFEYYDATAVTWKQVVTNSTALVSLNGSTSATQTFATGSAGTSFVVTSSNGVHTFNLPMAASTGVTQGALTNLQYQSFVDKVTSVSGASGQITITGTTSSPVVGLANSGVTAATYGASGTVPVITVDAFGRVTSIASATPRIATTAQTGDVQIGSNITVTAGTISVTSANVIAALGNALSGDVTGSLSATVVATVGGRTAANVATTVDAVASATDLNSSGTIVRRDANGNFYANSITTVQDMTVQRYLRVQNGAVGNSIGIFAPLTTSYNIILPDNGIVPPAGYGLGIQSATAGTVQTTWVPMLSASLTTGTFYVGNASGNASAVLMSGDATLASSGVLTLASVGAGVTSGTQYTKVTVDGKGRVTSGAQLNNADVVAGLGYTPMNSVSSTAPITISGGASNPVIGLANSGVTAATYGSSFTIPTVTVDAFGRITGLSSQTLRVADTTNPGVVSISSNITVSTSGQISVTGANVTSALGYTPVNKAGDTMTGALVAPSVTGGALIASNTLAVGTATGLVAAGSIVDFTSTTAGFLMPRMTTAQRNLIASGALQNGMQVFNTSTGTIDYYDHSATSWKQLATTSGALTSLNGLTTPVQTFATGSAGTSFGVSSAAGVHTFNFPMAATAGVTQGALSNTQYQSFVDKVTSVSAGAGIAVTGTTSSPVVALTTTGVTAATYGTSFTIPTFTIDAYGRISSVSSQTLRVADATNPGVVSISSNITVSTSGQISLTGANVTSALGYTPVNKAGDTMTGALIAPSLTGGALIASNTLAVGTATGSVAAGSIVDISSTTAGFLMPRMTTAQRNAIASGAAQNGMQIFNTSTNSIEYYDNAGSAWRQVVTNSNALTSLNGSASSTQTFATGSAGTSFGVVTSNGVHTFNFPMAATAGVTQGALSNTQYQSFVDKVTSVTAGTGISVTGNTSAPTVALATNGVTAATYGSSFTIPTIVVDTYGRISSVTSQTLRVADATNTGVVSIGANITVNGAGQISLTSANVANAFGAGLAGDVTGTLSATVVAAVGGKTSAQVSQSVSDTLNATNLNTASMIMKRDAAGAVSAGAMSMSSGVLRGSTAGTVSFSTVPSVTSYGLVYPATQGGSNQVLVNDGSGNYSWGTVLTVNLASGSIMIGDAAGSATARVISGDASISNTGVLTLSSTTTAGTAGSSSSVPTITWDAKGRITNVTSQAYQDGTTALKGVLSVPAAGNLTVTAGAISLTSAGVASALGTQSAKTFYAGPLNGAAAAVPAFRGIASSDISSFAFVNGGNSFTATAVLGTVDNNSLQIKTNSVTRLTVDTAAASTMTASVSQAAFTGQAYANVNALTVGGGNTAAADANLGNVMTMTTSSAAAHTVNVTNVQPGAAYTLSVIGTGANTGQVNITCNGSAASYVPANGARSSAGTKKKTIYTFVYDGTDCLVTWITGF